MVRIRYSALPAGQHVAARRHGRSTLVFLLPGLTLAERRAALATIRSGSLIGRAHRISALGLLCARVTDRTKTVAAGTIAAIRKHPAVLLPPLAGGAATILMLALTTPVALPATASQLPELGWAAGAQPSTQSGPTLIATPPAVHATAGRVPLRDLWRPGPGTSRDQRGADHVAAALPGVSGRPGAPAQPAAPVRPKAGESPAPRQPAAPGRAVAPGQPSPAAEPSTGTSPPAAAEPRAPGRRSHHQRAAPRPDPAASAACAIIVPVLGACLLA